MKPRSLAIECRALAVLAAFFAVACGTADESPGEAAVDATPMEPLVVAATSPVAVWLVRRIGGDDVRLSDAIPAGVDHHSFAPSAEQIVALGETDLIVLQGAAFEAWRESASLPESRVVDLSSGLDLVAVEGRTHSHGAEGEHSHTGVDPATWMDPALVLSQARRVLAALEQASPERAAAFLARGQALETELDRLVARTGELGEAVRAADVAVAGEASRYTYFARALGVELLDLPKEPGDHDLGHLRRAVGARRLVVLREVSPAAALRAKLPDAAWVELDPLAPDGPAGSAYTERMSTSLDRLEAALAP